MIDISYLPSIARRVLLLGSLLIASCCAALFGQPDGLAVPPSDGPSPARVGEITRSQSVDRELMQLAQRLTLTDSQQLRVKALLSNQKRQIDAIRKSMQSELSESDEKRERLDEIRDLTETKIVALLDAHQKVKFAAMKERRKTAMERRQQQKPVSTNAGKGTPKGL